jgi:membrane protein DedA with SNARE-associated domain
MIESLVNWLINLVSTLGYPGIAFSMFVESFFAPIPSELIMPFAGFLASEGKMDLLVLALVGGVSSYLGSLPFYFLGYWGNDFIVNKFIARYGKYLFISQKDVDRGFALFDKNGNGIVLLGRLVPLVRTVISFPAGVAKMNFVEFSFYTLIGSVLWSGFLATAGYLLGENWRDVVKWIEGYQEIIIGLLLLIIIVFIGPKLIGRKKALTD